MAKIMTKKNTSSGRSQAIRQRMILLLKLTFVVGLLYFLAKKGFISVQATRAALTQWQKIIPAFLGLCFTTLLGVFRWHWLLQAQNIHLRLSKVFQLTLIGSFFNIALPGAVSGDFVKAFYVGKEAKGQRTRAFGSILFDRVAGLSALVVLSASAILLQFRTILHTPLFGAIQLLVGIAAGCVVVFYGYLFVVRERHDLFLIMLKRIERKFSSIGSITRIYESLRHYHHHRFTVLKVLMISGLIQITVGWCFLKFAQSLGETSLSPISLCIIVPLGLLVTAIPVAPAGVGTGNLAFLYFFNLIGSERGADIFSLFALSNILIGFIGGIVYFQFRGAHAELPDSVES